MSTIKSWKDIGALVHKMSQSRRAFGRSLHPHLVSHFSFLVSRCPLPSLGPDQGHLCSTRILVKAGFYRPASE